MDEHQAERGEEADADFLEYDEVVGPDEEDAAYYEEHLG